MLASARGYLAAALGNDASQAARLGALAHAARAAGTQLVEQAVQFSDPATDAATVLADLEDFATGAETVTSAAASSAQELSERLPLSAQTVRATMSFSSNWDTGYCAVLDVENAASRTTTSWFVEVEVGADTIDTSWNVDPSALTGRSILTSQDWDHALAPGAHVSVGFCATRAVQNGSIAEVIRTSASFD